MNENLDAMMALNNPFWGNHFKRTFVPEVRALVEALETRLLPTFANVNSEAEAKQKEEWDRLCSLPSDGNEDGADLAESAFNLGLAHYQMMLSVRQGLLNLFAVALFHVYEQQVMLFHRRELLHPRQENDLALLKHAVFRERLRDLGIDVTSFDSSPILEELGLVANTVKHAEGDSSAKLYAKRPTLFESPLLADFKLAGVKPTARVFSPMMGDDIYVSLEDLKRYADAVAQFWQELSDALALVE